MATSIINGNDIHHLKGPAVPIPFLLLKYFCGKTNWQPGSMQKLKERVGQLAQAVIITLGQKEEM